MIIRKAKMQDVEYMHSLINEYANEKLMLARSRNSFYEGLREFTVAEADGNVVGVGGLHILWEDLGEIRSLAVSADYAKKGVGRRIVEALLHEARELGIPKVLTLTYQQVFFEKCGFKVVQMDTLPHKVWKECMDCPKFPKCDEIALTIELNNAIE
ncbi:MAG TPA: N-acetyltransferase [Bacillota bacterium]|nr:N-acetyltransferase [Bacillota bacterium]